MKKIFQSNQRLAAQLSIAQHQIKDRTESIKLEKKRRNRGVRLNLVGEEDSGPQFFSPGRVQAARDYQATKDAEEKARQQDILTRKALAVTKKAQKEEEKIQRAAIATKRRQLAAEAKAQKAVNKQAQKELREVAKHHGQGYTPQIGNTQGLIRFRRLPGSS